MVTLFPLHSRGIKNRQITQKVNKEQNLSFIQDLQFILAVKSNFIQITLSVLLGTSRPLRSGVNEQIGTRVKGLTNCSVKINSRNHFLPNISLRRFSSVPKSHTNPIQRG